MRGAAEVLDISAEAVRKRIARGTIPHERDEEGNVWVLLDGQEDGDRTASGHREDGSTMPLLSRMEDEIAYLRSRSEHAAAELERIPVLHSRATLEDDVNEELRLKDRYQDLKEEKEAGFFQGTIDDRLAESWSWRQNVSWSEEARAAMRVPGNVPGPDRTVTIRKDDESLARRGREKL